MIHSDGKSRHDAGRNENSHDKTVHDLQSVYYKYLCIFAAQLIDDHSMARTLVNKVFVALLRHPGILEKVPDIHAYLFDATETECRIYLKNSRKKNGQDGMPVMQKIEFRNIEDVFIETEVLHAVYMEVQNLPKQRRAVILKLFYRNLTSDQVAQEMNLKRQTVLNQKIKALHSLRAILLKKGILSTLILMNGIIYEMNVWLQTM